MEKQEQRRIRGEGAERRRFRSRTGGIVRAEEAEVEE